MVVKLPSFEHDENSLNSWKKVIDSSGNHVVGPRKTFLCSGLLALVFLISRCIP